MEVRCPQCKRLGEWFETKYGPFCSSRCRLLDLGQWFNEEHAISDPLSKEALEELAEQDPETARDLGQAFRGPAPGTSRKVNHDL